MKEDWPEILDKCIDDARGKPFVRGQHDCCMWTADTVLALTGIDYAKEFRGKYKTIRGARKALGKKGLPGVMDTKFSRTAHPKRGDIVLIPTEITMQPVEAIGICIGMTIALIGDNGLEFLPLSDSSAAWDISSTVIRVKNLSASAIAAAAVSGAKAALEGNRG